MPYHPPTPARSNWKRLLLRCAGWALIIYLSLLLMLAFLQRSLIYVPTRDARIEPADARLPAGQVHTITLRSADGLELRGWHLLPDGQHADSQEACDRAVASADWLVLYFSGNAAHRAYRVDECQVFTRLGCHVFIFDYRGYGDNPGSPSEERLAADALAAWRYATQLRHVPADRVLLYGESLGGGVAVRLAHDLSQAGTPPAGLILRSTFSSLVDVGAYHYAWLPVRLLMVDRFPSADRIAAVTCPILQIHGEQDTIVPIALAQTLFAAAPAQSGSGLVKQFVRLPAADHNDVLLVAEADLQRAVAAFLDALAH